MISVANAKYTEICGSYQATMLVYGRLQTSEGLISDFTSRILFTSHPDIITLRAHAQRGYSRSFYKRHNLLYKLLVEML